MPEIIALVNERDEIVGQTTKQESHRKGQPHRVAAIFVIKGNELLINKRQDNGLYDHSVSGHVRYGESFIQAARREAQEEIGLNLQPTDLELIDHYFLEETPRSPNLRHWFTLFRAFAYIDFVPIGQAAEVSDLFYQKITAVEQEMRRHPKQFDIGFLNTMNAYLKKFAPTKKPIMIK